MPFVVGAALAVFVGLLGAGAGLDRDRAYYPVVTIVIAAYYSLFAALGGSPHALLLESLVGAGFVVLAVVSFKRSLWLAAAALTAHGIFDLSHSLLIDNPGVPAWWPAFCLAFDVVAGAYLAWSLARGRIRASAPAGP